MTFATAALPALALVRFSVRPWHLRMAGGRACFIVEEGELLEPTRIGRLPFVQRGERDAGRSESLEQRRKCVEVDVRNAEFEQRLLRSQRWSPRSLESECRMAGYRQSSAVGCSDPLGNIRRRRQLAAPVACDEQVNERSAWHGGPHHDGR
jgi:hypothetical protein